MSNWSYTRIGAKDGKGIQSITEYYKLSVNTTEIFSASTISTWSTSISQPTSAKPYLLNAELVVYSDGTNEYKTPHVASRYVTDGQAGRGIAGITEYYLATSAASEITRSTSGWTTTIQTMTSTKKYLWNYEAITYSDNLNPSYTEPCIIGVYGDKGDAGADASQIGENLLHDSKLLGNVFGSTSPYYISINNGTKTANALNGFTQTYCNNSTSSYKDFLDWKGIKGFTLGDKYTLSFWAKGNGTLGCFWWGETGNVTVKRLASSDGQATSTSYNDGNTQITLTSSWQHYWITWQLNSSGDNTKSKYILFRANASSSVYIAGPKFEKGTVATAWVPHIDEYDSSYSCEASAYAVTVATGTDRKPTAAGCVNIVFKAFQGTTALSAVASSSTTVATNQFRVTTPTSPQGNLTITQSTNGTLNIAWAATSAIDATRSIAVTVAIGSTTNTVTKTITITASTKGATGGTGSRAPRYLGKYNTWISGKSYAVGDVVIYNTNRKRYTCKVAHTSSSSIIPTITDYWTANETYISGDWYFSLIDGKMYLAGSSIFTPDTMAASNYRVLDAIQDIIAFVGDTSNNIKEGYANCQTLANSYVDSLLIGTAFINKLFAKNFSFVKNDAVVWDYNTDYRINDIVLFSGRVYKCTTAHSSGTGTINPRNTSYWTEISDNEGEYLTGIKSEDFVKNKLVDSLDTETNSFGFNMEFTPAYTSSIYSYTSGIFYQKDDVVLYNNKYYRCIKNLPNSNTSPTNTTYWVEIPINQLYYSALWTNYIQSIQLIAKSIQTNEIRVSEKVARWITASTYYVNDVVAYNGSYYRCIAQHTSSSSILPTNTSYWNGTATNRPSNCRIYNNGINFKVIDTGYGYDSDGELYFGLDMTNLSVASHKNPKALMKIPDFLYIFNQSNNSVGRALTDTDFLTSKTAINSDAYNILDVSNIMLQAMASDSASGSISQAYSKSCSSYIVFSNGLKIQFGVIKAGATRHDMYFPISFSADNSYVLILTNREPKNTGTDTEGWNYVASINKKTASTANILIPSSTSQFEWFAIGY